MLLKAADTSTESGGGDSVVKLTEGHLNEKMARACFKGVVKRSELPNYSRV